jgi:ElaB/YqjD/DUF883 family membrane-anchored ribosome-binding protein
MAQENSLLKNATEDYEAVKAQMADMREEMGRMAHNVQAIASARGHAIGRDISEGLTESAQYLGRKTIQAEQRVEGAVAANPYIALGLAAGMGVLLGALTRR